MSLRTVGYLGALLLLGSSVGLASEPDLSEFTLEVQCPSRTLPSWFPVRSGGQIRSILSVASPESSEKRLGLAFAYQLLRPGQLSVTVDYYPDFSENQSYSEEALSKLRREDLGSYTLILDQIVRLDVPSLTEPVAIALRRTAPDEPGILRIGDSEVQSIEIGTIVETRGEFQVQLINRSSRGIRALSIGHGFEQRDTESHESGFLNRPLIPPGGSFWLDVFKTSPNGLELGADFTLQAIVFENGDFEGQVDAAAGMVGHAWGQAVGMGLLLPDLKELLDSPSENLGASLDSLIARLTKSPLKVPTTLAAGLIDRFPQFGEALPDRRLRLEVQQWAGQVQTNLVRLLGEVRDRHPEALESGIRLIYDSWQEHLRYLADCGLVPSEGIQDRVVRSA